MDAVVHDFLAVNPVLLLEVGVKPGLNVLNDGPPAVQTHQHVMLRLRVGDIVPFIVVDKVAETGRVNDRQTKADTALLNVYAPNTAIREWDTPRSHFTAIAHRRLYSRWRRSRVFQRWEAAAPSEGTTEC